MPDPKPTPEPKKPDIPKTPPTAEPKKPDGPAKADAPKAVPAAEPKKSETSVKADSPKAAPATEPTKPEAPAKADLPKTAPTAEPKKPEAPAKADSPKAAPAAEPKKPEVPAKTDTPKAAPAAEPKKPESPAKADTPKAAPVTEPKKPDGQAKADVPKTAPATEPKKSETPAKAVPAVEPKKPDTPAKGPDLKIVPPSTDKPKDTPAADPKPKEAAVSPKGVRITQILADRLEKPSEEDLKKIPQPKEGEGISMQLHPAYFFQFLDHPFTVNRETQDYKELFDSIRENGINEPIKARPREGGGLELISGHRRHDVAMQLNYPVPVVIVQMDDDSAKIEVVDGNLHRKDIPMSELARAAKMKMEALARKAGRRSKMEQLANGPQKRTDQIVAEDMGMSRNQVQRLVRIDALIPGLKQQVDDKKLPFNTAVELSYLTPAEQNSVAEYIKSERTVPSLSQAQELKAKSQEAAKAAKATPVPGAIQSHNYISSLPGAEKPTDPAPTAAPTPPEKKAPAPVTEKTIASIMKPKKEPEIKVTFTGDELRSYFGGKQPTVPEAKLATVEEGNQYYADDDKGVLFNIGMTEILCYPAAKADLVYMIPNTVTSTFIGNSHLKAVVTSNPSNVSNNGVAVLDNSNSFISGATYNEGNYTVTLSNSVNSSAVLLTRSGNYKLVYISEKAITVPDQFATAGSVVSLSTNGIQQYTYAGLGLCL